jgi:hypothetical protein
MFGLARFLAPRIASRPNVLKPGCRFTKTPLCAAFFFGAVLASSRELIEYVQVRSEFALLAALRRIPPSRRKGRRVVKSPKTPQETVAFFCVAPGAARWRFFLSSHFHPRAERDRISGR